MARFNCVVFCSELQNVYVCKKKKLKKKLVIKELLYLIITQKSCKSSCLWTQFRKHFGLTQALVSMPFPANPLFQPSLLDTAFQTWFGKGLHCIRNLFINGPLAVCLSYIVLSWIWKATLLIIWENDGENMELPEEPWQKVIKRIHTSSICVRHRLIQFKIFHCLHFLVEPDWHGFAPAQIQTVSDATRSPATVGHTVWVLGM